MMYRCPSCGLVSTEAEVTHYLLTSSYRECPVCNLPVVPLVKLPVDEPVSTIEQRAKEVKP